MNDIVEELRAAADDTNAVENASVAYLLQHAAGEIELLRGYRDAAEADAAIARLLADRLRLTEAEREAVAWATRLAASFPEFEGMRNHATALRGLLDRCAIAGREGD